MELCNRLTCVIGPSAVEPLTPLWGSEPHGTAVVEVAAASAGAWQAVQGWHTLLKLL